REGAGGRRRWRAGGGAAAGAGGAVGPWPPRLGPHPAHDHERHVLRRVVLVVEGLELLLGRRVHGLGRPEDRPPVGMIGEHEAVELADDGGRWIVLLDTRVLDDDLALRGDPPAAVQRCGGTGGYQIE